MSECKKAYSYNLGAVQSDTNEYVLPYDAVKTTKYHCFSCKQPVILRKGTVRKPHFSHQVSNDVKCTYYEHPNESELHMDAKHKLADLLQKKVPLVIWYSNNCTTCVSGQGICYNIIYHTDDKVIIEYRDPGNTYIADVAVLNDGKVKYIFEIKHTHATTTTTRPEPWYEFAADEILNEYEKLHTLSLNVSTYELHCIRSEESKNWHCMECRLKQDRVPWAKNLPRLPYKDGEKYTKWDHQESPCIVCGRTKYNPVFAKGYRQICKICMSNDEAQLSQKYAVPQASSTQNSTYCGKASLSSIFSDE